MIFSFINRVTTITLRSLFIFHVDAKKKYCYAVQRAAMGRRKKTETNISAHGARARGRHTHTHLHARAHIPSSLSLPHSQLSSTPTTCSSERSRSRHNPRPFQTPDVVMKRGKRCFHQSCLAAAPFASPSNPEVHACEIHKKRDFVNMRNKVMRRLLYSA